MTKEKKIENAVQRAVKKVLNGKYDMSFFSELGDMQECIEEKEVSHELPTFQNLNITEMKTVRESLKSELLKQLKVEEISFLEIMRIIHALDSIGYAFSKIRTNNNKIKFCIEIFYYVNYEALETIALLDRI